MRNILLAEEFAELDPDDAISYLIDTRTSGSFVSRELLLAYASIATTGMQTDINTLAGWARVAVLAYEWLADDGSGALKARSSSAENAMRMRVYAIKKLGHRSADELLDRGRVLAWAEAALPPPDTMQWRRLRWPDVSREQLLEIRRVRRTLDLVRELDAPPSELPGRVRDWLLARDDLNEPTRRF